MRDQAWGIARRVVAVIVVAGVLILCVLVAFVLAGQVPLSAGYLAGCIVGLLWAAYLYMEGVRLGLVVGNSTVALAMGVMAVLWAVSGH